jgi:TetR/AcrR family acrAB operon transcriptional repressor
MAENSNPARENRILDAAISLVVRYGYDKTTMDEIAHDAGVSKGALYLHFKGKEALFETLLLRETEYLARELLRRMDAEPGGFTLFSLYRHTLIIVAENLLLRALFTRDRRLLGDYARRMRDRVVVAQGFGMSVEFVKRYQAFGIIRDDIPPETVIYILAMIRHGLLTMDEVPGITPPLETLGAVLGDVVERGMGGKGGDASSRAEAAAALRQLLEWGIEAIRQLREKGEQRS